LDKKTELQKLERTYRSLVVSKLDFIDLEDFQFRLQCLLKMPCRFYADDFKKAIQDAKLNSNSVIYQSLDKNKVMINLEEARKQCFREDNPHSKKIDMDLDNSHFNKISESHSASRHIIVNQYDKNN
jgi:hypothetical protein